MGKKKDLTPETRHRILHHPLSLSIENKLPYGRKAATARLFCVSKDTVGRIWREGPDNQRKGNCGTKRIWTDELVRSNFGSR